MPLRCRRIRMALFSFAAGCLSWYQLAKLHVLMAPYPPMVAVFCEAVSMLVDVNERVGS